MTKDWKEDAVNSFVWRILIIFRHISSAFITPQSNPPKYCTLYLQ